MDQRNTTNKLDAAKASELQTMFDEHCEKAAEALSRADVLLVVTGAGFSADSGLAVFADIANVPAYQERGLDYSDLCQPKWVEKDPALFYGFWGQCFNDYRSTKPHEGYDIIARWRDDKNKAGNGKCSDKLRSVVQSKVESLRPFDSEETLLHTPYSAKGTAGAFFAFTSNADAHFYDTLQAHEIHDCHGSIELWQCSSRDCVSGIWRASLEHKFDVDTSTMLAPEFSSAPCSSTAVEDTNSTHNDDKPAPRIGHTHKGGGQRSEPLKYMPPSGDEKGWYQKEGADKSNWPRCGHCHSLARPAIFMFGDFGWKYDMSQSIRWDLWMEALLESVCEENLNVCVMEIGCGLRVATCRTTSEQLVSDVLEKNGSASLIRINPDFPLSSDAVISEHLIPIMSKGLRAIKRIDELYRSP